MYRWTEAHHAHCEFASCSSCLLPHQVGAASATENLFRFAAQHAEEDVRLYLKLLSDAPEAPAPVLELAEAPPGCKLEVSGGEQAGEINVCVRIAAAPGAEEDDEVRVEIRHAGADGVPPCTVVLRRTLCRVSTALLDRHGAGHALWPQTRAALLWYSWKRYRELVGLKRFTSGKSGSDVLVFRPRLREPDTTKSTLAGSGIPGIVSEAWGSYLLVKTGEDGKVREEWDRFQAFLADRLHPFMARSEAFLRVRPVGLPADGSNLHSTIIGSFLGGDLPQAEPFQLVVNGSPDAARLEKVLDQVFNLLSTWYTGASERKLRDWQTFFRFDAEGALQLFGKFNFSQKLDREQFTRGVAWDVPFKKEEHLSGHLLGKQRDGLLYRLMDVPVRCSLIHGDLHALNILADTDNVWLLDFGDTGVAPTLFDFAKLEVYLRLWCLDMKPGVKNFEEAAIGFETQLLDNMMQTEGSLESVRSLAPSVGAVPDDLMKIARCISFIRRKAAPYGLGSPDRRDYLAVLYLTVLHTLQFAGRNAREAARLIENYRLLMGLYWVLEDLLSSMHGLQPFARGRIPLDPKRLLSRNWLKAPGAPGRVVYLLSRPDGQTALEPLAATRNVLQSQRHHLDVFDHTLLVLAYIEELLLDPVGGLLDPHALDDRVGQKLRQQGIELPPIPSAAVDRTTPDVTALSDLLDELRERLAEVLDEAAALLLKWVALFHDVGKPATRTMNTDSKGTRERVQFLGHEVYGQQLIAEHAEYLFPDDAERKRFDHLLVRHHDHHNLVNRYLDPKKFDGLVKALASYELPTGELKYLQAEDGERNGNFPLLILHGFADSLACRGPDTDIPVCKMAEIDLLLLALFFRYDHIQARLVGEEQFNRLTKEFDQIAAQIGRNLSADTGSPIEIKGRKLGQLKQLLKDWFFEQTERALTNGEAEKTITRDALLQKAEEIARRRFMD